MGTPILAPNSTWYTQGGTNVNQASITQIYFKDSYSPSGTVTSSWDASAAKDRSVMCYVEGTKLTIAGNGSGKIMANADSSKAFRSFSNVTVIHDATLFDTSEATTMASMFANDSKLVSIDVSNWNTENVTTMAGMFAYCSSLESLIVDNWNVSKVETMYGMFQVATSLKSLNLSKWNVESVKAMNGMFKSDSSHGQMSITSIGDVSNWDVSKVTTMNSMFQLCSSLKTLDAIGWLPSACTDMANMFYGCSSLVLYERN